MMKYGDGSLTRLGDLISVKHGWPFESLHMSEYLPGKPIVVGIGNFEYTGGFRFARTTLKAYSGEFPKEFILKPGDILLAMTCQTPRGEILGIPGRIPDDGRVYLHNQRLGKVVIEHPNIVDASFLYSLFLTRDFNRHLVETATGTKILHTAPDRIESFQFLLPPLSTQRKIASILFAWDHTIDLTTQLIAAKQQRKRGLMQQLLTGKRRFTNSKGWSWRKIGDLFQSVTRFETWDDEKTYIQAIVKRWSQGIELRPPLLGKQIKTKNLQIVRVGDFLISDIQASYGAMSIVNSQHDGLYVSNVYTILVPKEDQIYTPYFDQLSRTSLIRHLVAQSSNGFKAERIRLIFVLDAFMRQKVYLPDDINEQRRIADLLQICDDEIRLLNQKLALLKKQKQGLMQQLLTGKVRVKT